MSPGDRGFDRSTWPVTTSNVLEQHFLKNVSPRGCLFARSHLSHTNLTHAMALEASSSSYQLALGYLSGGAASCAATAATNPIDVLKVDLQLSKRSVVAAVRERLRLHGALSYMDGSMPALVRAMSYSAFRLAAYTPLKARLNEYGVGAAPAKLFAGLASGATAAFLANPIEMVKVRSQAGFYRDRAFAFRDVLTHGFAGVGPHVLRGAAHTASQIGTYDIVKTALKREAGATDGLALHASTAAVAGVATTLVSSPFDVVKTHAMATESSVVDAARTVLRTHGFRGFWRGASAGYARTGPHTVITFIAMENLHKLLGLGHI